MKVIIKRKTKPQEDGRQKPPFRRTGREGGRKEQDKTMRKPVVRSNGKVAPSGGGKERDA